MNTAIISLAAITATPAATETALARRDELVLAAAGLKLVTTADHAQIAGEHLRNLKQYLADVEESRKAAKAPVDKIAGEIQGLARFLTEAVTVQVARLSGMQGTYLLEQQRIANEAAAAARAKEQQILDEAAAKADAAIASGRNVDAKLERIDAKAFDAVAEVRAGALALAAPKVEGVSLRTEPDFEVTDVHALYAAHPALVKVEVDRAALKAYLKKYPKAELPGVKHWVKASTAVRL